MLYMVANSSLKWLEATPFRLLDIHNIHLKQIYLKLNSEQIIEVKQLYNYCKYYINELCIFVGNVVML